MARNEFVLWSAPHGGRYAKFDESGRPLNEEEKSKKIALKSSLYSEHMPVTVNDTLDQMRELYAMGVRGFHDHSYDKNGIHVCNPKFYRDLEIGLREIDSQVIHSIASSNRRGGQILILESIFSQFAKMGVTKIEDIDLNNQEHFNVFVKANMTRFRGTEIPVRPDTITTLTNFEYAVLANNLEDKSVERMVKGTYPELIQSYYRAHKAQIKQRGVHEEIEISTMIAFDAIEKHFSDDKDPFKTVGSPTHFVILFNFSDKLRLTDETVIKVLEKIEQFQARNPEHKVATTFGLVIRPDEAMHSKRNPSDPLPDGKLDYRELINMVLKHDKNNLVGGIRFGTEDACYMYKEQRSDTFFAKEVTELLKEHDLGIVTDTLKAREVFNLRPRDVELDKSMATFGQDYHREQDVLKSQSRLYKLGFHELRGKGGNIARIFEDAIKNGNDLYGKYIQESLAKFERYQNLHSNGGSDVTIEGAPKEVVKKTGQVIAV